MGRGRAKAKQTKVARQLKYSSGGTDLSREEDDPYAQYADLYNDDDEDEDDQSSGPASSSQQRRGA
ncbi:MAG: DUF3073 family protein [Streptomyces turgidiscabies]|nr:DUF3073 family protein [Streptomyces turgidiscabies]